MRVVTNQLEVFELEVTNVFDRGIQFQLRQSSTITSELFARLLEMVLIKVKIAEGVDKIARRQIDSLRDHHRKKRVGRDVERHAEKQIAAALVELAT